MPVLRFSSDAEVVKFAKAFLREHLERFRKDIRTRTHKSFAMSASLRYRPPLCNRSKCRDGPKRPGETTLRRSPLRYASDWRQDIDTAPAALRMTSSTRSGFDNMGTCEDATSVVAAFMRFETERCRSG